MSLEPTSRDHMLGSCGGAGVMLRAGVVLLALGGVSSCSSYQTMKNIPIDCTVEAAYEFDRPINNFETTADAMLWTSTDSPAATAAVSVDPIPEGSRCGSTAALVIRSVHNDDWGSLAGINNFGPRNEAAYQGLSFWARAPGATTKAFTILFDDPNTNNPDVNGLTSAETDGGSIGNCKPVSTDAGSSGTIYDSNGVPITGGTVSAPPPFACGNGYTAVVMVTTDWVFYAVPFGRFQQAAQPNRVPNDVFKQVGTAPGTNLLTSELLNMTLRMPKEAQMELWIDNLGFYRKKGSGLGGDAGADAK